MRSDSDRDDLGLGRIERNSQVDQLQPECFLERRERSFYFVCPLCSILQTEKNIELLGAESKLRCLCEKFVEPVIENEDQLLEIIDREVELVFPSDLVLFYVRRQEPAAFLLDDVDDVFERLSVAIYQFVFRNVLQIADAFYPEVAEDIQRVSIDEEVL